VKLFDRDVPTVKLQAEIKGIGQATPLQFEASDAHHLIKSLEIELTQGGQSHRIPYTEATFGEGPRSWWKFWKPPSENSMSVSAVVGASEWPGLQEGRATLRITVTNDSWGRFFRGGKSELRLDLPVRLTPPQVQVLTSQHYIHQGGCELVIFKVSPGTTQSEVQVGKYFFPSWPVKADQPETRLCLFAYPYDVDPNTPAHIVARDDAGNQTISSFNYRVFPTEFRKDTLNLTDDFMARVVPPVLSETPELQGQGSLLKDFLMVNGRLRQLDAQKFVNLSHQTAPRFLWSQPFIQLSNSKVEASFADRRTYLYNGQVVDHQDHLGFDLAVTAHTPVAAANTGTVVYTGFLGIYGNAVVIDHGCGLQTLYGHLSSIEAQTGQSVQRGQILGRSGQTGLAGGDHLHFSVLLDGIPVDPNEWWDPHWIHDRLEAKLEAYH